MTAAPHETDPVKFLCGILTAHAELLAETEERLADRFGPVDVASEVWDFEFTHYYDKQMGTPLVRKFLAFEQLRHPDDLIAAKLDTNAIEADMARLHPASPPRVVNLDPGYVEPSKLVLASMKNFSHRIHLAAGVYGEVTLMYLHGQWDPLRWTFPDYGSGLYFGFLDEVRNRLKEALSRAKEDGMIWAVLAAFGVALGLSAMLVPVTSSIAVKIGLLDVPARHKTHASATPLLGGTAIFLAVLLPSMLVLALARLWAASDSGVPTWLPEEVRVHVMGAAARAPQAMLILLGAIVLHVMGILDDIRHLGPWIKLIVQLAVASVVVSLCPEVRIVTAWGKMPSVLCSILWLVTICNAINFMDNMDGLAAGVAAICSAALVGAGASCGQVFVSGWGCLLLGLLGFLPYNFSPAKVFMGDGGSLVIGYFMAVLSAATTYVEPGQTYYLYGVFVPVVLMAVPLYDTVSVVTLRLRDRMNPMVGDRRHFSHRLVRRGMSVRKAVLTIYLCTGATAVSASLLPMVGNVGAILLFAQTAIIILVVALLEFGDKDR